MKTESIVYMRVRPAVNLVTPELTKTVTNASFWISTKNCILAAFSKTLQSCQHVAFVTQWFLVAHESHL